MKKLRYTWILLGILSTSFLSFGQVQVMNELIVTPPVYHNSTYNTLTDFLLSTIEYPESAINGRLQGTEVVQFRVTASGKIEEIKVINSISKDIDKDIISILQSSSKDWSPGTVDGKPTSMVREVAVIYTLSSLDHMKRIAAGYFERASKMLFTKENPEKALSLYNKVYCLFPCDESVLMIKEICLEKLGRDSDAEECRNRLEFLTYMNEIDTQQAYSNPLLADNHTTAVIYAYK